MPRYLYRKLVRDRILKTMIETGEKPDFRQLEGDELELALGSKVVEEAHELQGTKPASSTAATEVAADVIQAALDFAHFHGATHQQVEDMRTHKLAKFGGFEGGFWVESTDISPDNPFYEHIVDDPRYTAIPD